MFTGVRGAGTVFSEVQQIKEFKTLGGSPPIPPQGTMSLEPVCKSKSLFFAEDIIFYLPQKRQFLQDGFRGGWGQCPEEKAFVILGEGGK